MQMTAPTTDVHGGFVLQLQWLRGSDETSVTTAGDGNDIFVADTDTAVVKNDDNWQVS